MTIARLFAITCLLVPIACAGARRDVLAPGAPLGRVVIYRNGVAYFERVASAQGELTLSVPRERVDDFLKSLRVADAKSGEPLPVSYKTMRTSDDQWFHMRIAIPRGRHKVKLTYVTESPAWKPSYRVVLGDDSRLQALAIIDNVSGERWRAVELGLGTTSALSFRYDLHSVQSVAREEIRDTTKVGVAPPTGGSPYTVDGKKVRVLAVLDATEAQAEIERSREAESVYTVEGASIRTGRSYSVAEWGRVPVGETSRDFTAVIEATPSAQYAAGGVGSGGGGGSSPRKVAPPPEAPFERLVGELRVSQTRVRVEALALADDTDRDVDPLRRANTIRETLVRAGIDRERIDAVGVPELADEPESAVRVVAVDEPARPTQARAADGDGEPTGTSHFVIARPMTIDAGDSAMVTLFDEVTPAERVYLYDPISARGSNRFAFTAVRIVNPSDNQLDAGPVTVYADKRFLGEGMTDPIPAHGLAIVPYALDRSIAVEPRDTTTDEVESLRAVERGIATAQTRRTRHHELVFVNRGKHDVRVFVRHRVPKGWTLREEPAGTERMGRDLLVPVRIAASGSATLVLDETLPMSTSIDLHAAADLRGLAVHVDSLADDSPLRRDLTAILAAHRKLHDLAAELATRRTQAERLRERVAELTTQLATLGKLGRAKGLSGDLARRARQLGEQYERAAGEIAELERERLARNVELENLVAELRLPAS